LNQARFGVWIDLDRLGMPASPDDSNDPAGWAIASNPLPMAADGCRWLLGRAAPDLTGGLAWPQAKEMVQTIRPLGT